MNEVYRQYFPTDPPARTTVGTPALARSGLLIEIEMIAYAPQGVAGPPHRTVVSEVGLDKVELDTPVLWVDLNLLEDNIERLAAHFKRAGVGWRPHTKGMKVPAIAHKALAAGAVGVTCAKLGEAEVMASAGIRDLLIANQIVTPPKITRLVNLIRHAKVKVAVDDPANVAALGAAAEAKGVELGVLVDIDCGMHRTGVTPEAAAQLAARIDATAGLSFLGVMSWEGHVLRRQDPAERERETDRAVARVAESVTLCEARGLACEIVSCGGSGTVESTPFKGVATEIQAGGIVFSDVRYQGWTRLTEPSLFVRAAVTSRPTATRVVTDAGFKALPLWHAQPQAIGFPAVASVRASAEHGILELVEANDAIAIGDAVDFVVGYGDATVFLHDHLYGLRDGVVEAVWPVAGRGKLR